MDLNENERPWKEIYDEWKKIYWYQFPELSKRIQVEKILVKNSGSEFVGYDWISNKEFENLNPIKFMHCGNSINNGALQTLKYLLEAKDDKELLAAIWIFAFTRYLLHELRHSELKNEDEFVRINKSAEFFLIERDFFWKKEMKVLLPEMCISNTLLEALPVINQSIILQFNALACSFILAKYSILEYNFRKAD